jgi:hypothetical protein
MPPRSERCALASRFRSKFAQMPTEPGARTIITLTNSRTGEVYIRDDNIDYGVILRVQHSAGSGGANYFFIVTGLSAAATWAASNYLHANWRSLQGKPPEFAIILKVPRATPELISEVLTEA